MKLTGLAKYAVIVSMAITTTLPFVAPIAARAQYITAGCSEMVRSSIRQENEAENESDAGDYVGAYSHYQEAAIYRANCVNETSGRARQWNMFFESMDYFGLSVQAGRSDLWSDQAEDFHAKAHDLANELLGESLPSDLHDLAQTLWRDTSSD